MGMGQHSMRRERPRRARWRKAAAATAGAMAAAGIGYAVTNWTVGLNPGSSGQAQSGAVQNLTFSAIASPSPQNLLFPGGSGDAVVTITNPNPFPVDVTAVQLPTDTTYADGYTSSTLVTTQTGCAAATPSGVAWNYATATSGSSHTLTTPLVVGASGTLTVTLTDDVAMGLAAPAACEGTYFKLPSLTGVTALDDAGATATASPATDAWTA